MSQAPDDLPEDLKALLSAERDAPGPSAGRKGALWAQLERDLPAAATPPSPTLDGSAPPGPRSWLGAVARRHLAIGFIAGSTAGAVAHATLSQPVVEVREVVREVVKEVRVEVPVTRTVTVTIERAQLVGPGKPVRRGTASTDTALADERRLIEQARAALARRSPEDAAQALDAHRAKYPDGRLAEEREALQIMVLVRLDRRPEARDLARKFLEKYPNSVLRPMVQSIAN